MENLVELQLEIYMVQLDCKETNVQLIMVHDVDLAVVVEDHCLLLMMMLMMAVAVVVVVDVEEVHL